MASTKPVPLPSLWTSFKSSFYNPEFYKKIPTFSVGKALGYLILFVTLCYLLALAGGATYLWQNREKIESTLEDALDAYPADLEITFTNGKLSTNVTEPYFYPSEENTVEGEDVFVVIDTKTPFSIDQFNNYGAILWFTTDTIYVREENQGVRMYPYSEEFNFTVNRENIRQSVEQILPELKKVALTLGTVVLIFLGLFLNLYYLVYLLLPTFIYWVISQLNGEKKSFENCYKTAIYASTPVGLLQLLMIGLSAVYALYMPPFLFTAVLLLTILLNVQKTQSEVSATRKKAL